MSDEPIPSGGSPSSGDGCLGTTLRGPVEQLDPRTLGAKDSQGGTEIGNSGTGGSEEPRRRGRKPGTKNKSKGAPLDLNSVELILFNMHSMLAAMIEQPHWALSTEQAETLAKSIKAVADQYDWIKSTSSGVAWTNLFIVAGMTYIPRVVMSRQMSREKEQPKKSSDMPPFATFGDGQTRTVQ